MKKENFTRLFLTGVLIAGMSSFAIAQDVTLPATAAPVPTHAAGKVLPIYTDVYEGSVGVTVQAGTGGTNATSGFAAFSETDEMFYIMKQNGGAGGLDFNSAVDATGYDYLHFDIYVVGANIDNVDILFDSAWASKVTSVLEKDQWVSIDVKLEDYLAKATVKDGHPDLSNLQTRAFWLRRSGGYERSFFLDNIYFWKEDPTGIDAAKVADVTVKCAGKTVELESGEAMTSVQVFNIAGQSVRALNVAGNQASIDLAGESNGIYLVRIALANGERMTKKIMNL